MHASSGRKCLLKGKSGADGALIFSYAASRPKQPHLGYFESKQGENSTAIEGEEPFFLPGTQRTNNTTDTAVAFTSNVNTNFPKTWPTGSSEQQRHFMNRWVLNSGRSDSNRRSCVGHIHVCYSLFYFLFLRLKQQAITQSPVSFENY